MASLGTTPLGAILVARLASSFNARVSFLAGGAVVLLTGMAMLALTHARQGQQLAGSRYVAGRSAEIRPGADASSAGPAVI